MRVLLLDGMKKRYFSGDVRGVQVLNQRATINPYYMAASLVVSRLAWDIRVESWRSRRKFRECKDKYLNQKAVIICNGPSLLEVDLNLLEGVYTLGLNKINLLFDKSSFRPSCIVSINPLVIEQNAEFFNRTEIQLFLDSKALNLVSPRENIAYFHSQGGSGFARDCSGSLLQGHTVTFAAMQIAFHLGFQEVALIGCDHTFATQGPANSTVVSGEEDASHFDKRYFSGGQKWQLPDLFESEVAYIRAKNVYEAQGRKLINSTIRGKLEIFERRSLADFVGEK